MNLNQKWRQPKEWRQPKKWRRSQNKDNLKNKDDLRCSDDLKNEDHLKFEDDLHDEDDLNSADNLNSEDNSQIGDMWHWRVYHILPEKNKTWVWSVQFRKHLDFVLPNNFEYKIELLWCQYPLSCVLLFLLYYGCFYNCPS